MDLKDFTWTDLGEMWDLCKQEEARLFEAEQEIKNGLKRPPAVSDWGTRQQLHDMANKLNLERLGRFRVLQRELLGIDDFGDQAS